MNETGSKDALGWLAVHFTRKVVADLYPTRARSNTAARQSLCLFASALQQAMTAALWSARTWTQRGYAPGDSQQKGSTDRSKRVC